MKSAVIIGGGIHGLSCADELSKKGISVTVIEKFDDIFKGASGATHNRAHSGFHYPRSIDTAKECIAGLRHFQTHFPQFLSYPKEFYYFIEKNNTKTTTQQYIDFCKTLDLEYHSIWPDRNILDRRHIDSSFLVKEPCFNLKKIKDYYLDLVSKGKIKLITSFDVDKGKTNILFTMLSILLLQEKKAFCIQDQIKYNLGGLKCFLMGLNIFHL